MAIKEFSSIFPSCKYCFTDGTEAIFMNGRYRTDNEGYIKELMIEIKKGHPHIFNPRDVDTLVDDPLATFKQRMRAELLAEIAVQEAQSNNPTNDRGGDKAASAAIFGAQSTDASLLTITEDAAKPKLTVPVINIKS